MSEKRNATQVVVDLLSGITPLCHHVIIPLIAALASSVDK